MKNFWRFCFVLLANKLLRNGQRRLWGSPHSSWVREETVIFLFRAAVSPSQPQGDQRTHGRDDESNCSFQKFQEAAFVSGFTSLMSNSLALSEKGKKKSKKFFFFKQKKHTCKLPCQLASQGCQTHLAPKEAQKANSRNRNPKFIFITAKVFSSWSLHPGLVWMSVFDLGFDFVQGMLGFWDLVGWAKKKPFVPFWLVGSSLAGQSRWQQGHMTLSTASRSPSQREPERCVP